MSITPDMLIKAKARLRRNTVRILSPFSQLSTYMVETEYLGGMKKDGETRTGTAASTRGTSPPWVKIGELYVSTLEGNNEQWVQLVDQLYGDGARKFAVFTGRHGDEVGTHVVMPSGTMHQNTTDFSHYQEDTIQAQKTRSRLPGSLVVLKDVGKSDVTLNDTRALTRYYLWMGYSVLYAWCFSLLSMYEFDGSRRVMVDDPYGSEEFWVKIRKDGVYQTLVRNKTRPIDQIVKQTYSWVPGCPT